MEWKAVVECTLGVHTASAYLTTRHHIATHITAWRLATRPPGPPYLLATHLSWSGRLLWGLCLGGRDEATQNTTAHHSGRCELPGTPSWAPTTAAALFWSGRQLLWVFGPTTTFGPTTHNTTQQTAHITQHTMIHNTAHITHSTMGHNTAHNGTSCSTHHTAHSGTQHSKTARNT